MMIRLSTHLLLSYLLINSGLAIAGTNGFEASPLKCVTLKQGNDCYQDIEVEWQSELPGNYCLYLSSQEAPLKCWSNTEKASLKFEFIGSNSSKISLIETDTNKLLGQVMIEVKWVYRNRSRNLSWRVF